jgi:hypothetical protein
VRDLVELDIFAKVAMDVFAGRVISALERRYVLVQPKTLALDDKLFHLGFTSMEIPNSERGVHPSPSQVKVALEFP